VAANYKVMVSEAIIEEIHKRNRIIAVALSLLGVLFTAGMWYCALSGYLEVEKDLATIMFLGPVIIAGGLGCIIYPPDQPLSLSKPVKASRRQTYFLLAGVLLSAINAYLFNVALGVW
jgi:hypothetical protein